MLARCPPVSNIQLHGAEGVEWEPLVRGDCNTEEAGVGVDEPSFLFQDSGGTDGGKGDDLLGVLSLSGSSRNDGMVDQ